MVTVVAPEVQQRFDKIIDLKMTTQENILAFWNQFNYLLTSDVMVITKMSKDNRSNASE